MNGLPPALKMNVLKSLSSKMRAPKQDKPLGARLQRKVDPDYMPHRKYNLTNKLFKS